MRSVNKRSAQPLCLKEFKAYPLSCRIALGDHLGGHDLVKSCAVNQQILSAVLYGRCIGHAGIRLALLVDGQHLVKRGLLRNCSESHRLGRCIHIGIGRIALLALEGIAHACRFQVMRALIIIAVHDHFIPLDLKEGHGQRIIRTVFIVIIAHKAGIHIGKRQRFHGKSASVSVFGDLNVIALLQIHCRTAQIIVPAVGVVMSVKIEDVQPLLPCLIHGVKERIRINAVPVDLGAHAVVQGQVGKDENGAVISCLDLFI